MKESISVSNLFFDYPGQPVLTGASFSAKEGEFIAMIGPNGGGKTTLLYLLMGFYKPKKGEILLYGKSPKNRNVPIGFVPQAFQFDRQFPITAIEVILMGKLSSAPQFGGYQKEDTKDALALLERVGLKGFAHVPFSELSGGQAQRVLFARALACKPKLLFLDEAVANIDPQSQENIFGILNEIKKEITILLVTHDLRSALSHVDRLIFVQNTVEPFSKEAACSHYAMGLYHPPLKTPIGAP